MHRIDSADNDNGLFRAGDPQQNTQGTVVSSEWLNDVQEAIMAVIEAAGITADKGRAEDLLDAIHQRIEALTGSPVIGVDGIRDNTSTQKMVIQAAGTPSVFWWKDPNDILSADNGTTVIVDAAGQRWKPQPYAGTIVFSDGTILEDVQPADPGATNRKIFQQDAAPVQPGDDLHTGDLWYDTDDGNRQYRWDGLVWVDVADEGAGVGRDLALAAAAQGKTIEEIVIDAVTGAEGTPVSSVNVNDWSGTYTPTSRSHVFGISVVKASGRITIKHRGVNSHNGTADVSIELEVQNNTLNLYENIDAETVLVDNVTNIDFTTDTNKWGPNGFTWNETLTNTTTDSFNVYLANTPVSADTVIRLRIKVLETTDSALADTWVYLGDTPIIINPPIPMQLIFAVSDTSNQDVLLMVNAPATAGADKRSNTIAIKPNYSNYSTVNPGEAYIHGFGADGNPADVDGFIVHNGQILTIDRTQTIYTGSTGKGYIVYDTLQSDKFTNTTGGPVSITFAIKYRSTWRYDNNTSIPVLFTPAATDIVIGTMAVENDNIVEATIWPYGQAMSVVPDAGADVTESYPLANLNVAEWYTSPYSPGSETVAMLRIRINRSAKIFEVLFGGFNAHTGAASVDMTVEVSNNTFADYTNITAETSLVDNVTNIDFQTQNLWGPNGFRWAEGFTGTDQDKFEMELTTVPGANTVFKLRISVLDSVTWPVQLALGSQLVAVDPELPMTLVFSPTDGTDYDVLVMQNAPAEAGATNSKTFYQIGAPANPGDDLHTGDLWYDTDDGNKQYRWSGTVWEAVQDAGAAFGATLSSDLASTGATLASLVSSAETVPMGATNVTEWYTSPYSPAAEVAGLFRIRINRSARILEVRMARYNGVGTVSVDVEVEVFNNTFTAYTNSNAETSLTTSGPVDFLTANRWGANGFRWSESASGADSADVFEMTLANVPGANTVFRVRIRSFSVTGGSAFTALGNLLLLVDKVTPFTFYFSPTDGTDYDVLVMQNAPAEAGATNSKTFNQTTAPANPGDDLHTGDIWFDTDDGNKQYRWSGSAWVEVIDSGADTGREVAQAIADEGLSQTVADFVTGANDGGTATPIAAQNVNDWATYWIPGSIGRGSYIQTKIDKTTGIFYFRHKTQASHTGIAGVKVEIEPINNTVTSFTNTSSALTPVNDVGGVNFADTLATTKLHWGPNGVIYYETITNIGEHEFNFTCTTIPLTRDHNFRLKIRYHFTNDSSGDVYYSLGDTSVPLTVTPTRPKQLFFGPIDSTDYDVLVMDGAEPILAGTGGSFRNGFEPSEFTKWTGSTVAVHTAAFYSGSQSGLFTYTGSSPAADGTTGAARIAVPDRWALEFANQRIRVSLYAKRPASSPATTFAVAYSTNNSTETSGWQNFSPTTSWVKYTFNYDVPVSAATGPHYLGVWADTSNSGLGVLIDNIIVEAVQKPSEIDGTSLLNASQLISSVETSINETTTPTTIFSTGTDYATWVDIISTTVNTTGTDLLVINGSSEMLIDRTIDTSDVTILSLNLLSTTNWTLNAGWSHLTDKIYHTTFANTDTLDYAVSGLTAGSYYRVEANVTLYTPSYSISMTISSGATTFEGSISTTNNWTDGTGNFITFKATGTTATLRFTPVGGFNGYVDYISIKKTAPGLQNAVVQRQTAGPGGPVVKWRVLRGATTIHESQGFMLSGAGQVPALFLDKVDTSSPGGSQTYKFQMYWTRGAYDSGQIASWEINSDKASRLIGTGTYWGTYLAPGAVITWGTDNLTAEVISVLSNTEVLVLPTYYTATTVSFTSGTGATTAVPSGAKSARIRIYGGGGGGGYNTGAASGGGGAGGFVQKFVTFTAADVGKLFTYTVGALGTGKAAGSNGSGVSGGNTTLTTSDMSFTNLNLAANGGVGGATLAGSAGGSASGGDINVAGGAGIVSSGGTASGPEGGPGGGIPGIAGLDYGGGGAGGTNSGAIPGSNGAVGYVVIDYLPDLEGSTNTNYTSLNSTHKLIMRMAQAFIQVTEYRN
jgi:hypothetical protein